MTGVFQPRKISVHGVEYASITEAARALGIPRWRFANRLARGCSPDQAAALCGDTRPAQSSPGKPKRGKEFRVGDRQYRSITEAARELGIDRFRVYGRVNKAGWSVAQALGIEDRPSAPLVTVDDLTFESLSDAARHYDIHHATVYSRLRKGWSVGDALKTPSRVGLGVTVGGQHFRSHAEAARHFGLSRAAVWERLDRGWTTDEAFGVVPRRSRRGRPSGKSEGL